MKPFNPRSTVFTNLMLDIIMPAVPPNAWKILCYAMRKTAGWVDLSTISGRKESDVISLSQFSRGCGIKSENTVMEAIDFCLDKGYLIREQDGQSYRYRLNTEYELDASDIEVVEHLTSSEIEEVVTKTSSIIEDTNSKLVNSNKTRASKKSLAPAKKNGDNVDKETYLTSVKKSVEKSYSNPLIGYAHYPERLIPVVEKMEKFWYFKPPAQRSKQFAFWISSCDEIISACDGLGLEVIDKLHDDWVAYMDANGGVAPHTVSSPKSLVNDVLAKAALMRGGSNASLWRTKIIVRHSQLDV